MIGAQVMSNKTTNKTNPPAVTCFSEDREAIKRIGDEWRMSIRETVAALRRRWELSTDEERIEAIRRPVETLSA